MKIRRLAKALAIVLSLILLGFVAISLFLRSETGRQWAQREAISWIQKEYGVSIQYQSLTINETAVGWDLSFSRILWKLESSSSGQSEDFPGQPIELLQLSVSSLSLVLKQQPVTAIFIKGLILRPSITADGVLLRGAAWRLDQAAIRKLMPSSLTEGQGKAWPTIRVEDVQVEFENLAAAASGIDLGLTTVQIAGEWSAANGLRDIKITSSGIDLVKLAGQAQQLGSLLDVPTMVSAIGEVLDFVEQGAVNDLQVQCAKIMDCVGSVNVKSMRWKEQEYRPGVNELSAHLEFDRNRFEVTIPHAARTLTWSKVYRHPVSIDLYGTRIKGVYDDETLTLDMPHTRIDWNRLPLEADAQLKLPLKNMARSNLMLRIRNASAPWNQVKAVLPDHILGPELMSWLSHSLRKGQVHHLNAELKGPLRDFPFVGKGSGLLAIDANFSGIQLADLDQWPDLNNCQGHVKIQGSKLAIDNIACQNAFLKADRGKLEILDLLAVNPLLKLELEAQGNLQASMDFLQKSPLRAIKDLVAALGLSAPLQKTKIALVLPLRKKASQSTLRLKGETTIPSAELVLPRRLLTGTLRQFQLRFDQNGLEGLTAELNHSKQTSQLVIQRDPTEAFLDLKLSTPSLASGLRAALRLSPAQRPQRIEGNVKGWTLQEGAARLSVESVVWQGMNQPFHLKGQAIVNNFGIFSPMLGLGEDYKEGRGTIGFDLHVPGNLSLVRPASLAGNLDFDLNDGTIENLSATSMTFINIANLKVFGINSRSLHYNFLKGRLVFDQGSLSTEHSMIGLGALEIQAKGSIHYPKDSLNLEFTIIPDLGSPVASLAIGLWNPLVGLGLYGYSKIQNKASDSRLNRLASQTYRMKGSIDKPEISLINLLHLKEIVPWTKSKDKEGASK